MRLESQLSLLLSLSSMLSLSSLMVTRHGWNVTDVDVDAERELSCIKSNDKLEEFGERE